MIKRTNIMMMMSILLSMLLSGCDRQEQVAEAERTVHLSMEAVLGGQSAGRAAGQGATRAHWELNADNTATFRWDESSDEMVVMVCPSEGSDFLKWGADGKIYTYGRMTPTTLDRTMASMYSVEGVSLTDKANVAAQKLVYCVSPIYADAGVNGSTFDETNHKALLRLPDTFEQTQSGALEEFRKYTYIYAETPVVAAEKNVIEAQRTKFLGVPAVVHFVLTNADLTPVIVTKVSMTHTGAETDDYKHFPQEMTWMPSGINAANTPGAAQAEPKTTMHDGTVIYYPVNSVAAATYNTVATRINGDAGETLDGSGGKGDYFIYVFPTAYQAGAMTLTVETKESPGKPITTTLSTAGAFMSNYIYTLNLSIGDYTLLLNSIEITPWTVNANQVVAIE